MQREFGPRALVRLIWGALRLDAETFRRAAGTDGLTRLHVAVALLAALSTGFATATGAVAAGVLGEKEAGFYQAVVMSWALAFALHFLLFLGIVWLIRKLTRSRALPFDALTRLLALSLAPYCASMFLAWAGLTSGDAVMRALANGLGASWFFLLGTLIGYYPDDLTILLSLWSVVIAISGLRVGGGSSLAGATATVLVASRLVGPLPELADLVMNGVR